MSRGCGVCLQVLKEAEMALISGSFQDLKLNSLPALASLDVTTKKTFGAISSSSLFAATSNIVTTRERDAEALTFLGGNSCSQKFLQSMTAAGNVRSDVPM